MEDLQVALRDKLDLMYREARSRLAIGKLDEGILLAETGWKELPEPKFGWDVSKSYAHALALVYRDTNRYHEALSIMSELFKSGTVKSHQDQPYFITGTIYFEMGDVENARKWLEEANRISKGRCFRDEPEKYERFLKS